MTEPASPGGPTRGRVTPRPSFDPLPPPVDVAPEKPKTPSPGPERPASRNSNKSDSSLDDSPPEGHPTRWKIDECERYIIANFSQEELDAIYAGGSPALWHILNTFSNTAQYNNYLAAFMIYSPHLDWMSAKDAKKKYQELTKIKLRARRSGPGQLPAKPSQIADPSTPKPPRTARREEDMQMDSEPIPPLTFIGNPLDSPTPASTSKGKSRETQPQTHTYIAQSIEAIATQLATLRAHCQETMTPGDFNTVLNTLSNSMLEALSTTRTPAPQSTPPGPGNPGPSAPRTPQAPHFNMSQGERGRSPLPIHGFGRGRGSARGNFRPYQNTSRGRPRTPTMPPSRNGRKPSLASRISDPPSRSVSANSNNRTSYAAVAAPREADILKQATDIMSKAPTISIDEAITIARSLPVTLRKKKKVPSTVQGSKASEVQVRGSALIPERAIPVIKAHIAADIRTKDLPYQEVTITMDRLAVIFKAKMMLFEEQRDAVKDAVSAATNQPTDILHFMDRPTYSTLKVENLPSSTHGIPTAATDVMAALLLIPDFNDSCLVEPVVILPNKQNVSVCTALVKIYDDRKGHMAKYMTKHTIFVAGEARRIKEWANKPSTRQCTQCQKWGHVLQICRARSAYCAVCGEPYPTSTHHLSCSRCASDNRSTTLCTHRHCINCGGEHEATSRDCPWFLARNNAPAMKALMDRRSQNIIATRSARTAARRFTTPSAPAGPSRPPPPPPQSQSHHSEPRSPTIRFETPDQEMVPEDLTGPNA